MEKRKMERDSGVRDGNSRGGEWRPFLLQAHRYFFTFYLLSYLLSFFLFLLPYYFYRTSFAFCQSFLSLFAIILTSKSWKRSSIWRVFTQETSNQLYPIVTELHLHNHAHKTPPSSMTFTWQCSAGDNLCDVQAMLLIFAFTALKFRKKKHSQWMS